MWSKVTSVSMKRMQDKSKLYNIHAKAPTPPSNQAIWMTNTNFPTQEGNNQNSRFLNDKGQYSPWNQGESQAPPQPKANQIKHQTQQKTSTPPEDQMSLDTPQDKHRSLKQQSKSKRIWPRHKSENNHQWSQAKPTCHPQQEKCGPPQQLISKQGRNQPTENHIYTGDEHHDRINMGHNQGIVTQSGEQIRPHKKQV
jgi:hypothetical protein